MKECGLDVPPFLRVNKLSFVGMIADSFVEKVCTYHAYIVSKIEKEMGHVSKRKKNLPSSRQHPKDTNGSSN